jgi:hypothetical protein
LSRAGEDSGNFHRLVTVIADLSLFPFALALGLDFFITAGRVFGEVAGAAAGTAATGVAVGFWYGFPRLRRRYTGEQERAVTGSQTEERSSTPLHAKIEQMLTEARVVLPGAQALFGFQLAIVLTQSFEQLPSASKITHAASLFLVALAVVLLMAPAEYHRIVCAGEDSGDMHRVGSALVTAATVPLALGLVGDVYVVITKIVGTSLAGLIAGQSGSRFADRTLVCLPSRGGVPSKPYCPVSNLFGLFGREYIGFRFGYSSITARPSIMIVPCPGDYECRWAAFIHPSVQKALSRKFATHRGPQCRSR